MLQRYDLYGDSQIFCKVYLKNRLFSAAIRSPANGEKHLQPTEKTSIVAVATFSLPTFKAYNKAFIYEPFTTFRKLKIHESEQINSKKDQLE